MVSSGWIISQKASEHSGYDIQHVRRLAYLSRGR
jgi:hypothetical protein